VSRQNKKDLRSSLYTVSPDPTVQRLTESYNDARATLARLRTELGPENTTIKQWEAAVEVYTTHLDEKIGGVIAGMEMNYRIASNRLFAVNQTVTNSQQELNAQITRSLPYIVKKKEQDRLERLIEALQLRVETENLDVGLSMESMVKVIDKASKPEKPDRPSIKINVSLGIVFGLILGVGLAFFIEYLDTSVKTIDDVERALQAPVLAVIPQNVGTLLFEGPESPHAEAYRVLRTNILFARKDPTFNTMTVVSAGAGEGKSTTLFNLATTFAQNGARVLVVDSDLRRPSIHKILNVSNSIGLTNFLLNQNTLEEVIQRTSLASLDVLPSGKLPSSSMGILSSPQMKALIGELKRRYDFVFFDSPPIMGISDAAILASEVDLVMQVIQYRRYPQPMTIRAKQMIQKVGGNLLGIVLNNINMSSDENYYYYSGYYYDYYSKQDDDDDSGPKGKKGPKPANAKSEIKSKY
jgi:capsular exopolysaccharide synthesis family protein